MELTHFCVSCLLRLDGFSTEDWSTDLGLKMCLELGQDVTMWVVRLSLDNRLRLLKFYLLLCRQFEDALGSVLYLV